jgi:hypothetical protein
MQRKQEKTLVVGMPTTRVGKMFVLFMKKRARSMKKRALFGKKRALIGKMRALFGRKRTLFGKKGSHLKHISAPWRMLNILFFIVDTRQMVWLSLGSIAMRRQKK